MLRSKGLYALLLLVAVAAVFVTQAICQEQPAQPDQGRQGRQGRGNMDPAAMQQRMDQFRQQQADQMKKDLGCTDEEFKVIQPKLEKVQTLQTQSRGGMMGFMGGRMGRGGPGGGGAAGANQPAGGNAPPQSDIATKAADLRKVLDNKDAKPEDIKTALTALRAARAKAKAELEAAQEELKKVLSVRQEAVLVNRGTLE